MGWFSRKTTEEEIEWQIEAHRDAADDAERRARWADRLGVPDFADRQRANARLDRRLADQQEECLRSGRYRNGRRQYPAVEDQLGEEWT